VSAGSDFDKGKVAYESENYKEAVNWFKKSAEQGIAEVQMRLGIMYAFSLGVLVTNINKINN